MLNRDKLTRPIQLQLSKKQKTFSAISFAFLNSLLNFKHWPKKKMTLIVDVFLEISAAKNMVRQMSKKPCFRGPLYRQRGKCMKTLVQPEWQHLYNIY